MVKSINAALERLIAKEKDYDFAILQLEIKGQMIIGPAVQLTRSAEDPEFLVMDYVGTAPFPPPRGEQPKEYMIESCFSINEIKGVEFYSEKRIKGPGMSIAN